MTPADFKEQVRLIRYGALAEDRTKAADNITTVYFAAVARSERLELLLSAAKLRIASQYQAVADSIGATRQPIPLPDPDTLCTLSQQQHPSEEA